MLDFSATTFALVRAGAIVPDISESILSEEVTDPQAYAAARLDGECGAKSV